MKLLRGFCEEHPRFAVVGVVLIALGLRLVTLKSFSQSIYGSHLMPDEQVYDIYARSILKGESLPPILGFATQVPAYVFSIAYAVLGVDSGSVRILNVLLGSATCLSLYFAGQALHDRTTGLLAALLCALYGPFVLASVTAHKTALGLFLISVAAALGMRCVARPRVFEIALFAIALGLSTHVRGNALILVLAAPIAFWWVWRGRHEWRPLLPKLLAFGIGLAVVLVPLSNEGTGFNLYLANSLDNPTPYYRPARFAPAQPAFQAGGFVLKASLDAGRRLSMSEARDYYDSQLRADWAGNVRAAAVKVLAKLAASVNVYEHAHNHNLAFVSRFVPPLAWPWIGFGLLFPLAMLGIVDSRGALECQWLIFMATAYWLTLVVFFTEIRLRAPLALLLVPLAAIGLRGVFRRRGRALVVGALIFGCGFAVTHLPVPGAGDLTTAYNLHALMLFDSGDYESAERYYRVSHSLAGLDSDSALLGLAAIAMKRSDLEGTNDFLMKMSDDHYKASEKYEQLGDVLVMQHRFEDAGRAFERAIEINPGLLRIYPVLEMLYSRSRSADQVAETRKRYKYAASFFE